VLKIALLKTKNIPKVKSNGLTQGPILHGCHARSISCQHHLRNRRETTDVNIYGKVHLASFDNETVREGEESLDAAVVS
jgi:hypothetical protein